MAKTSFYKNLIIVNIVYNVPDDDKKLTLTEVAQRWRLSIEKFTVMPHCDTVVRALVELSGENTEKLGQLTIVDVYDEVSFVVHSILRASRFTFVCDSTN